MPTTVTITINPINDAPLATNDSYSVNSDTTFSINAPGLLANDADVDGDPLSAVLASSPAHGALALNADGSFTYTPAASYFGSDAFTYKASDGKATSTVATVTLTVVPAPIVVSNPAANQIACVGDTVTFSVTATGTALTYQWFKATNALAGKTNSTLVLTSVGAADAATYKVRLTGATNSITNSATLTVNVPVSLIPLANLVRYIGSVAIFNANVTNGTGPFSYLWLKNGSIIPGQTSSNLVLTNLTTGDTATYSAVAFPTTGACGSVTNSATLSVASCFDAVDAMLVIDRSGSMSGRAYADARTACTNFIGNMHLTGATNDAVGLVSFNPTATLNQTLTNKASVLEQSVNALGPATNGTCISCGLQTGQSELLSARHRLEALPVLVLLSDGLPHDFDTPSNALFTATQAKNAGTRIFTVGLGTGVDPVLMANMASSTNDFFYATNSSQLTAFFDAISTIICRPPTNIFGPSDVTVCAGAPVIFNVQASGCALFSYQWRKDGVPLAGQTNNSISLANVAATNAGLYSVVVSSACRTVTNSATLTVNQPATVVTPLANQASYVRSNVVFNAGMIGTSLSYQWFFNGSVVSTSSALVLNNLSTNDAGPYCAVVTSGACGGPVTNCATLMILNRAPLANNDAYTTAEDTALTIFAPGVLSNDTDPDGNSLIVVPLSGPTHGTLTLNANGSFAYAPAANFYGTDSFTYRASDGDLLSGVATVILTVTPVNDPPVAQPDRYTINEDTVLAVNAPGVLGNDSDIDGDVLSAALVNGPSHGAVTLNSDGSFNYTPATNFHGVDSFTYRANDGQTNSGNATVTITVNPVNDAPVAVNDDQYITLEDTKLDVPAVSGVLTNDFDVDGDALTAILASTPTNGVLALNASGAFVYLPNTNFHGTDYFTYRVTDGFATSEVATVTITVLPVNDVPVAQNDSYIVNEDTALTVAVPGVLVNDIDVDGDALSAVAPSVPTHGTVTLNANGSFSYTPSTNYHGPDSFTYRATDGVATSAVATVSITVLPVNDPPVANNDNYTTDEDVALVVAASGVLGNDTDIDGDALTVILANTTTNGVLTLNTNGAFIYLPNTNFHGVDHFTYRVTDGVATSEIANVTITVVAVNDVPIANNDNYTTDEDVALVLAAPGVLSNDLDVDGDTLSATLVSGTTHGTLVLNSNGSFTYTPNADFNGGDSFTYRASDGATNSNIATVTLFVRPVNDRPIAHDDGGESYSVLEDHTLLVIAPGVLANDTDVDGDPLTAALVSAPSHGTVILNSNGSFTYTPVADYFGSDSFTYVANDGRTNSAPATVSLTVLPVNDAPSFVAGPNQRVNFNTTAQTVVNWASSISAGPANESAQIVHFVVSNDNPSLFSVQPAVSASGALSYTPAGTGFGVATVTVVLKDDGGIANGGVDASIAHTFAIALNGPPAVSIVNPTNGSVFVGTSNITVIAEASDPDSMVTNVQIFLGTNAIGTFTNAPYFVALTNLVPGFYSFRAVAVDDLGLRATSSIVLITVTQSPPVSALGPIVLNHQNGLFEQFARISNPTPRSFPNGVRLLIAGLDTTNRVYNATGTNAGVPYIDVLSPLPTGAFVDVLIQYYVPNQRSVPSPTLLAQPLPFTIPPTVPPVLSVAARLDTHIVLQFTAVTNRLYYLQFSDDFAHWSTLSPLVPGAGDNVRRTNSLSASCRFFRVLLLP